ncbi:Acg family FMN-binding oxidoreductase [Qaidamihabitans albus]|uniref:Acg family FMN-binding oxidoreductase n=1 Tax=Qaidamihabitans albus TaxID=2795733 RepID=UPI0018F205EC|nr:nitroreductase family protein [Qaidamihabitans albus]
MKATQEWTAGEIDVLARAVVRAPSVHNTQPWSLELPDGEALLFERTDLALPYHDPLGRDRAISCGTAIANLELGMRVLGRRTSLSLLPDPERRDLIARVSAVGGLVPTDTDLHRYSAIARRRSYRQPFAKQSVSDYDVKDLLAAPGTDGVQVVALRTEAELAALAGLLDYAATVLRQDRGYQRELALWTIRDERSHRHGVGVAGGTLTQTPLPWAGLVRPSTPLPDPVALADRLAGETVLLFLTSGDTRLDHVRAGIATEHTWLTAVHTGLAAAMQTQPLHLSEVRSGLIERLGLSGYPQLLMRVGHPAGPVPQSPRRSVNELLRPE